MTELEVSKNAGTARRKKLIILSLIALILICAIVVVILWLTGIIGGGATTKTYTLCDLKLSAETFGYKHGVEDKAPVVYATATANVFFKDNNKSDESNSCPIVFVPYVNVSDEKKLWNDQVLVIHDNKAYDGKATFDTGKVKIEVVDHKEASLTVSTFNDYTKLVKKHEDAKEELKTFTKDDQAAKEALFKAVTEAEKDVTEAEAAAKAIVDGFKAKTEAAITALEAELKKATDDAGKDKAITQARKDLINLHKEYLVNKAIVDKKLSPEVAFYFVKCV